MQPSSACLCKQALVIWHVYPPPPAIFPPSCLLHIPSARRTNVIIWNPEQSSVVERAPAQPSYLLISSGRGQEVRQGRAAACRHHGAQGPTHWQSCRPRCRVISSRSCCRGPVQVAHYGPLRLLWGSRAHSSTQTYTHAKLWTVEYKTEKHSERELPRKGEKLACAHTHSLTHWAYIKWKGWVVLRSILTEWNPISTPVLSVCQIFL